MGWGSLFLSLQEGANVSKCGWLRKGLGGPTQNPDWAAAVAGCRQEGLLGPDSGCPSGVCPLPGAVGNGQGWERSSGPWGMAGRACEMCLASETLSASGQLLRAPGSGAVFSEPLISPCGVSADPTPQVPRLAGHLRAPLPPWSPADGSCVRRIGRPGYVSELEGGLRAGGGGPGPHPPVCLWGGDTCVLLL